MEKYGVTEVFPEGEPFDPELHEAMTMQPSDTAEPNTVLTVVQKRLSAQRPPAAARKGHRQRKSLKSPFKNSGV